MFSARKRLIAALDEDGLLIPEERFEALLVAVRANYPLKIRRDSMLTEYIRAAMHRAKYEILPDDSTFYGEIPSFQGVYANATTLEDCREQLQEILEGWIVLGLCLDHSLPVIDGLELAVEREIG
jgi:predicted RNase H-like HicB family nuclease